MRQSETVSELSKALVVAAAELRNPHASASANTGKYSYRYAPLDEIINDVRAVLAKHGLAALQEAVGEPGRVGVTTRIVHSSGEWIECGPLWLPAGEGAQQHGSALTYARRYALTAALLLAADEDTDAADVRKSSPTGEVTGKTDGDGRSPVTQPVEGAGSKGDGEGPNDSVPSTAANQACEHDWKPRPQGWRKCSKCDVAEKEPAKAAS
jgi:hypothetical protein